MANVMSLQEWLRRTQSTGSIRSAELRRVDKALEGYHQNGGDSWKRALFQALQAWINEKGGGWYSSVRNRDHAVEDLYDQLKGVRGAMQAEAKAALKIYKEEQEKVIERIFKGKKLALRDELFGVQFSDALTSSLGIGYSSLQLSPGTGQQISNFAGGVASKLPGAPSLPALPSAPGLPTAPGLPSFTLPTAPNLPSAPNLPFGGGGSNYGVALSYANKYLGALIPPDVYPEAIFCLAKIVPNFLGNLAAQCVPFAGLGASGLGFLIDLKDYATTAWDRSGFESHARDIRAAGNPRAALEAMAMVFNEECNRLGRAAAISGVGLVAKTAAFLLDAGTVSNAALSIAQSLATLTNIACSIVVDLKEKNVGNQLMREGPYDIQLVEKCPILGAYYVCIVPDSVMVNQLLERFDMAGFQQDVEANVREHVRPVQAYARKLIGKHRYAIWELKNHAGMREANKDNLQIWEWQHQVGIGHMEGRGPERTPNIY